MNGSDCLLVSRPVFIGYSRVILIENRNANPVSHLTHLVRLDDLCFAIDQEFFWFPIQSLWINFAHERFSRVKEIHVTSARNRQGSLPTLWFAILKWDWGSRFHVTILPHVPAVGTVSRCVPSVSVWFGLVGPAPTP